VDSATLAALRGRLQAALVAVDQLIAADGRRCADCNRRSDDLTLCADEQWRGPSCRKRWERGVGIQLPVGDGQIRPVRTTVDFQKAGLL
jgi:hypothetical protein